MKNEALEYASVLVPPTWNHWENKKFEDTKEVIKSHKSKKDKQFNDKVKRTKG